MKKLLLTLLCIAGLSAPVAAQQNVQQTRLDTSATRSDPATGSNPSPGTYNGSFTSNWAIGPNGSTFALVYEGSNATYFGNTLATVTIGPFNLVVAMSVTTQDKRVTNRTRADTGYNVNMVVSGLYAVGTTPPPPLVDGPGWHYVALSMEQSTTSYTPSTSTWVANTSYPASPIQTTNGNWTQAVPAPNSNPSRAANLAENWHLDEIAVTGDTSTTRMADTSPGIQIMPVEAITVANMPTGTFTGDPALLPSPTINATNLYPDHRIVVLLTRPDGTVATLYDASSSTGLPTALSTAVNLGSNATGVGAYTVTVWEETPIDTAAAPTGVSNPTATVGGYSTAQWGWKQLNSSAFSVVFTVNISQASTYTAD